MENIPQRANLIARSEGTVKPFAITFIAPNGEGALRERLGEPNAMPFGGAELQMSLLGHGLADRGHQVTFVCSGEKTAVDPVMLGSIRVIRVPLQGKSKAVTGASIQSWLRRALNAAAPDVVYQRCALPLTGRIAWECTRRGSLFVFGVANDRDVDGRIRLALGNWRYLIYRYGLRKADLVIAQSALQLTSLAKIRRRKSMQLPSAFPFADVKEATAPQTGSVVWVGNLLAKKRPELLLKLARELPQIQFLAFGADSADPSLAGQFKSQAAALQNLEYRGSIPHCRMNEVYDQAAILLNTSSAEGVPNTFLEAWARGIPVATLGVDPDGLLSRHGMGCVLNPQQPASSLLHMLSDENMRRLAGARGRQYVRDHHDVHNIVQRLEQALEDLIGAKQSLRPMGFAGR